MKQDFLTLNLNLQFLRIIKIEIKDLHDES